MRKTISAVALLLAALLAFFPPVRTTAVSSWSGRTCLLASKMYRAEVRNEERDVTTISAETTSIDLPRLIAELLCVGSAAGFLIVVAGTRTNVERADGDTEGVPANDTN